MSQHELIWSQEKFEVLDYLPEGTLVLRHDFTVLFWNRCLEDWTGIAREDITNTKIDERFAQFADPLTAMRIKNVMEGGPPAVFSAHLHKQMIPCTLPNKQLRIQHTIVTSVPNHDQSGFVALLTLKDVTELVRQSTEYRHMRDQALEEIKAREKVEAELRASQRRFALLVEQSPAAIIEKDVDSKVIGWNAAAEQMFGYCADEVLGHDSFDLLQAQLSDDKIEALKKKMSLAFIYGVNDNITKAGERITSEWYNVPVTDDNNEVISLVSFAFDVTHRTEMENALRQSEGRNRALLEAIPDIIFRVNSNGQVLDASYPAWSKSEAEDSIGKSLHDLFPEVVVDQYFQCIAATHTSSQTQHHEYQLQDDRGWRDYEVRLVASGADEVVVIVRDVTERKQAERAALQVKVEQERRQVLANFIQTASHEFGTPLSIINTSLYLMEKTVEGNGRLSERVQTIQHEADNIQRLVNQLTTMTRLDGYSEPNVSSPQVSLNEIARNAHVNLHSVADTCDITVETDFVPDMPFIAGNVMDLQTAVNNVVENALRFTLPGGQVTLRTRKTATLVALDVIDTGIGIDPDEHELVFQSFYRADKARSTRGFGLGLTIARKIIELHNGTIELDSTLGVGSTFTLSLPLPATPGVGSRNVQTGN